MPRLDDLSIKAKMATALAPAFLLTVALASVALRRAQAGAALDPSIDLWIATALGTAAVLSALAVALAILGVSRPLLRLAEATEKLAAHDLAAELEGLGRKDEIGRLARALQNLKQHLIEAELSAAAQERTQEEKERRRQAIEAHIQSFDRRQFQETLHRLANAATALRTTAAMSRGALAVPAPSGAGRAQIRTVASAADRLTREALDLHREVDRFLDRIGAA
jgi:methyl-accepting chemotaxis protein